MFWSIVAGLQGTFAVTCGESVPIIEGFAFKIHNSSTSLFSHTDIAVVQFLRRATLLRIKTQKVSRAWEDGSWHCLSDQETQVDWEGALVE